MALINLEACKQMLKEKHFKAAVDDIIKYAGKKKLIDGDKLPDKWNWADDHYRIDELKYYQENYHGDEEDW